MKIQNTNHRQAGMTLIEMLAVIVIIAVLMGMLFPVVSAVRTSARLAQANVEAASLATAFKMYENEYGYWPTNAVGAFPVNASIVAILSGTSDTENPRKIRFYDFPPNRVTSAGFVDPFPASQNGGLVYQVVLDQDYDNVVNVTTYSQGLISNAVVVFMQTNKNINTTRFARSWK